MKEFFEYLNKVDIRHPSEVEGKIYKLPVNKVIELLKNCYNLVNLSRPQFDSTSIFNFSANTPLSGGVRPCSCIECRLKNAYKLSILAALYSDTVVVPNLFDYSHHAKFNFKNKDQEFNFYNRVAGDIIVFLHFKPLIEVGIIQVNPTVISLCRECLLKTLKEEKNLKQNFNLIERKLENNLKRKIKFIFDTPKSIVIQDSEKYTDTEVIEFSILPSEFKKYIGKIPYTFNTKEAKKLGLFREMIFNSAFDDLILQKYSLGARGLSYLTNRRIDSEIIEAVSQKDKNYNRAMVEGLTHSLPFLEGVDIEKILRVRKEDNLAFRVYRDAIKKLIKETEDTDSEKSLREAVNDIVIPEVNKIENIINNSKRYFRRKAKHKIIFDSIVISIGMLGSTFFSFDVGQLIKALGGTFLAKDILKDLSSASNIPIEARNNNYYFLWKIKNK